MPGAGRGPDSVTIPTWVPVHETRRHPQGGGGPIASRAMREPARRWPASMVELRWGWIGNGWRAPGRGAHRCVAQSPRRPNQQVVTCSGWRQCARPRPGFRRSMLAEGGPPELLNAEGLPVCWRNENVVRSWNNRGAAANSPNRGGSRQVLGSQLQRRLKSPAMASRARKKLRGPAAILVLRINVDPLRVAAGRPARAINSHVLLRLGPSQAHQEPAADTGWCSAATIRKGGSPARHQVIEQGDRFRPRSPRSRAHPPVAGWLWPGCPPAAATAAHQCGRLAAIERQLLQLAGEAGHCHCAIASPGPSNASG